MAARRLTMLPKPDLPPMIKVARFPVSHVGHDGQALYVRWMSGKVSRFHGVPGEDYAALLTAPNVHDAVWAIGKRGYPHEHVDGQ